MSKTWKTLKAVVELPVQGELTAKTFAQRIERLLTKPHGLLDLRHALVSCGVRVGRLSVKEGNRVSAAQARMASPEDLFADIATRWPLGTKVSIEHDGFVGFVRGYYQHEDGKTGVVLRQEGTKVTHVYSTRWLK